MAVIYAMTWNLDNAWISYYIYYKVWDEIMYPFPSSNGVTLEVWKWIMLTHTLLDIWLFIHDGIKVNPCQ